MNGFAASPQGLAKLRAEIQTASQDLQATLVAWDRAVADGEGRSCATSTCSAVSSAVRDYLRGVSQQRVIALENVERAIGKSAAAYETADQPLLRNGQEGP